MFKDRFTDNEFNAKEWSAPVMSDPEEIRDRLDSMDLVGRKIETLRFVGMDYIHTQDHLEEYAYNSLSQLEEDERQRLSDYDLIDSGVLLGRCAEIDEPLQIGFEDKDSFEIDTPQDPEFRFSLNYIPWHICEGTNLRNVDADMLFSPCIGKTIKSVEVETRQAEKDPMYGNYLKEDHSPRELAAAVVFVLQDDSRLRISPHWDFCHVALYDRNEQMEEITFGELKEGLYNWEDLHIEKATGFRSDSGHLYFNDLGRRHVGSPYQSVSCGESEFFINYDDSLLLNWSVISYLKRPLDSYEELKLDAAQWEGILRDAEYMSRFESFDDLFDELLGRNITDESGKNTMLFYLNGYGADLWKKRKIHCSIVADIRRWTIETMPIGGMVTVCGD